MYNSLQLAAKYLCYYLTASNSKGHGMHSPFVFGFIQNVLNNKSNYHPPNAVASLKRKLERDRSKLAITDLGAGSRQSSLKERTVADLAKNAVKPKKYAQMMFRLASHYKPRTVVELGTSLGITTAYLASANSDSKIITIEGAEPVAAVASWNFKQLELKNIQQLRGNFDDVLPELLDTIPSTDLAYVDGNHRYGPTVAYFEQLLKKANNNTIIVFDDIHWSKEMEKAWDEIRQHPSVRCSIDIFFMGFVFFREEFKTKQHHTIRY